MHTKITCLRMYTFTNRKKYYTHTHLHQGKKFTDPRINDERIPPVIVFLQKRRVFNFLSRQEGFKVCSFPSGVRQTRSTKMYCSNLDLQQ